MKQRNIPEVRRCCNGSNTMRGGASHFILLKKEKKRWKNKKVRIQIARKAMAMVSKFNLEPIQLLRALAREKLAKL